ncbi:MAG TPA: DUF21 domain-containing protein, partial [Phaeodactylibacter sp.]|nr:DUF21 domain-containing protein [Phaeodactylibacter sp.]
MEPEPHSDLLIDPAYAPLLLDVSSPELLLGLLAIVLLLGCSALISGSEVAYFSLTHEDFKQLKADESVNGIRILKLTGQPRRLLATILISNNFINIAIVILSDFVLHNLLLPGTFEQWSVTMLGWFTSPDAVQVARLGRFISFLITVAGVTFLLVLFGEVAPKIYAKLNNKRLALLMARPLSVLLAVFRPLSMLLVGSTRLIEQRL